MSDISTTDNDLDAERIIAESERVSMAPLGLSKQESEACEQASATLAKFGEFGESMALIEVLSIDQITGRFIDDLAEAGTAINPDRAMDTVTEALVKKCSNNFGRPSLDRIGYTSSVTIPILSSDGRPELFEHLLPSASVTVSIARSGLIAVPASARSSMKRPVIWSIDSTSMRAIDSPNSPNLANVADACSHASLSCLDKPSGAIETRSDSAMIRSASRSLSVVLMSDMSCSLCGDQ